MFKNECTCGDDEFGRYQTGYCDWCKKREEQARIAHQASVRRMHEVSWFGKAILQAWTPEMMNALDVAIRHSGNNPSAKENLVNLKRLLAPAEKITSDGAYLIHYDESKAMERMYANLDRLFKKS